MCATPKTNAISQYEIEQKPNQFQMAYSSPMETMYIDLSTIHLKQETPTYKTIQTRAISVYKQNQSIADYTVNFTYYNPIDTSMAGKISWQIGKPQFFALNGFPIDTLPDQRSVKAYGQYLVQPHSVIASLGQYVYKTNSEIQRITYLQGTNYIPPKVYPSIIDNKQKTALFGILPPVNPDTPMNDVIPSGPPPIVPHPPVLRPSSINGNPPPPEIYPPQPPTGPQGNYKLPTPPPMIDYDEEEVNYPNPLGKYPPGIFPPGGPDIRTTPQPPYMAPPPPIGGRR